MSETWESDHDVLEDFTDYIDNRVTLNGRLIPADDIEVLLEEEEDCRA